MNDKHLERALNNTFPEVVDVYITLDNGDEYRVFKKADDVQMENKEEDDQTLAEIKERMKTRELEKTAVEWLIDWMKANQYSIGSDLLEAAHTAKAMEYFQNKKMYERGVEDFVKKVNQLSKPSSNEK